MLATLSAHQPWHLCKTNKQASKQFLEYNTMIAPKNHDEVFIFVFIHCVNSCKRGKLTANYQTSGTGCLATNYTGYIAERQESALD